MEPEVQQPKIKKGMLGWLIGLGSVMLVYVVLGLFDDTTELSPNHDNILLACFGIAGLSALASGVLVVRNSRGAAAWQRAAQVLGLSAIAFICVSLATSRIASIAEGLIDFPPGSTKICSTRLLISRAYQTHGKGGSRYIQTTPIWSNLEITADDYEFMLSHRRVGSNAHDPDEISSNGYFCATVTLEQSGSALRVLHAGSHKLPKGSVVICPDGGTIGGTRD